MSVLTRRHMDWDLRQQMVRFRRELDRLFGRWGIDVQDWPAQVVLPPP